MFSKILKNYYLIRTNLTCIAILRRKLPIPFFHTCGVLGFWGFGVLGVVADPAPPPEESSSPSPPIIMAAATEEEHTTIRPTPATAMAAIVFITILWHFFLVKDETLHLST